MNMLVSLLAWVLPPFLLVWFAWWRGGKTESHSEIIEGDSDLFLQSAISRVSIGGERGGSGFFGGLVLLNLASILLPLGLIPWLIGWLIAPLPTAAGRQGWRKHAKARSSLLAVMFTSILLVGFIPVQEPVGHTGWGGEIEREDSAPFWPASEQKLWFIEDEQMVVTLSKIRLPTTHNPWFVAAPFAEIISATGADEARLQEGVVILLGERFRETFTLKEIPSEGVHTYSNQEFVVTRHAVFADVWLEEVSTAELVTVWVPKWGGVVETFSILRLKGDAWHDPWAEEWVEEWLTLQKP